MREECQSLVAEMQALLDTKMMLDAEIAIYRKMLEGEESRVSGKETIQRSSGQSYERTEPRRPPPVQETPSYRQTASWEQRREVRDSSPRSSQRQVVLAPRQEIKIVAPSPPVEPQPSPRILTRVPSLTRVRESPRPHRNQKSVMRTTGLVKR